MIPTGGRACPSHDLKRPKDPRNAARHYGKRSTQLPKPARPGGGGGNRANGWSDGSAPAPGGRAARHDRGSLVFWADPTPKDPNHPRQQELQRCEGVIGLCIFRFLCHIQVCCCHIHVFGCHFCVFSCLFRCHIHLLVCQGSQTLGVFLISVFAHLSEYPDRNI
jgi:hypothetical protein